MSSSATICFSACCRCCSGRARKGPPLCFVVRRFCTGAAQMGRRILGLPPATTRAQLRQYAAISQEHDRVVNQPVAHRLNPLLKDFGVGPLSMTLFDSVVELADAYIQTTVPSF